MKNNRINLNRFKVLKNLILIFPPGSCVDGDFSGPTTLCNITINTNESTLYKYANCPDVDECGLGIHDCHENAECINTHGSFK